VLDLLFHRLTVWLAPILVFTMEDVWLDRFPGDESSVHLQDFPETPAAWRDDALAEKWAMVRKVRRVVTGAIEIQRQDKAIGASLEAAPLVEIGDPNVAAAVRSVDMADICIVSGLETVEAEPQRDAFQLDDPGIGVVFARADGEKCERCWKILPDVGAHAHPGVCARCDAALEG